MRLLPLCASTLVLAAIAGSPAGAATQEEKKAAQERFEASRLYGQECQSCHGESGTGDSKTAPDAPDLSTPQAVVTYTRERMLQGVPEAHPEQWEDWQSSGVAADMAKIISYMREAFMLPAPTADASTGRAIFAETCSVCHGDRGDGASWAQNSLNPAPADFTSDEVKKLSRRHMINTVTYGSEGTAMQGFLSQLNREEISAVVDYIRTTFMYPPGSTPAPAEAPDKSPVLDFGKFSAALKKDSDATADQGAGSGAAGQPIVTGLVDMAAPMPFGLEGNAEAGREIFQQACYVCHGREGGGDGPRAYFINPKPANLTAPESRESLSRPELYKSISHGVLGSEMPAWSKVLSDQEIANVAEYVFQAFIKGSLPAVADKKKD